MQVATLIVTAGGTVVVPSNATFLSEPIASAPTLAYGQKFEKSGFHIMETPTDHPAETLTGLGSTGVEIALAHIVGAPLQSHVMVPLVQISTMLQRKRTTEQIWI